MKRRLHTLLALLCVLLCVAVAALWARSHTHLTALVPVRTDRHLYGVSIIRGGVYIARVPKAPNVLQHRLVHQPLDPLAVYLTTPRRFAGFGYVRPSEGLPMLRLPAWFVLLVPMTYLLAIGWGRARKRRRRAAGLCPACGYDLRATPGRCPECGAVAGPASAPDVAQGSAGK